MMTATTQEKVPPVAPDRTQKNDAVSIQTSPPIVSRGGTAFDRVRGALERHGSRIEFLHDDDMMAQCPAHEDGRPSLHVTRHGDRVLLRCFAGCPTDMILADLGITPADLFDTPLDRSMGIPDRLSEQEIRALSTPLTPRPSMPVRSATSAAFAALCGRLGVTPVMGLLHATCPVCGRADGLNVLYSPVEHATLLACRQCDPKSVADALDASADATRCTDCMVMVYDAAEGTVYRYADGLEVSRSPGKRIRQHGHTKGRHPLFNAADAARAVARGDAVWLVEGEKDAGTLTAIGVPAVSAAGGGGNLSKTLDVDAARVLLDGAHVTAVVDGDDTGRKWKRQVADVIGPLVADLRFVRAVPPAHDASDAILLDTGFEEDIENTETEGRRPVLTPAGDVHIVKPRFLEEDTIPLDVITNVSGRAGETKSTLTIDKAAKATRGELPGDYEGRPITVAFSAFEDPKGIQVARLKAAGADLSRVLFLDIKDRQDGEDIDTGMSLPDDLPGIEKALTDAGVRLWVIDPITSAVPGDTNKSADVRHAMDPLAALAQRTHIAILVVQHFNKGGGYASDKISGSHAWRDVAKSVLLVARDDDSGDVVVTVDKTNYSTALGRSWTYRVESVDVTGSEGQTISVPRVIDYRPSDRSVSEIINAKVSDSPDSDRADRGEVLEWLTDFLQDGPAPFKDILGPAKAEGYSADQLRNAQKRSKDPRIESVPDLSWTGRGQRRVWRITEPITGHFESDHKSKTQAGVGLPISGQLVVTSHGETLTSNQPITGHSQMTSNDHKSKTQAGVGLPISGQLVVTSQMTSNQQPDGPQYASDVDWPSLTDEQLVQMLDRGGLWRTKAQAEITRRKS